MTIPTVCVSLTFKNDAKCLCQLSTPVLYPGQEYHHCPTPARLPLSGSPVPITPARKQSGAAKNMGSESGRLGLESRLSRTAPDRRLDPLSFNFLACKRAVSVPLGREG